MSDKRVRILTSRHGYRVGQFVDMTASEAAAWVGRGDAEAVAVAAVAPEPSPVAPVALTREEPIETAEAPAVETAVRATGKARR